MNYFTETLSVIAARAEAANGEHEGDYTENGLLHCGKCRTPKQCRVTFFGREETVFCTCKCRQEEIRAERERTEAIERARFRETARRNCFRSAEEESFTFSADNGLNQAFTVPAKRYAEAFGAFRKRNIGLLLWGMQSTGKTFTACCICNAVIEGGYTARITTARKYYEQTRGLETDEKSDYLLSVASVDLLVIDDIGTESQKDFRQESIYNLVNARYASGKPMIVTTNLSLEDFKNPRSAMDARIYDRILERCHPLKSDGVNQRRAHIRDTYADTQSVLFPDREVVS